MSDGNETKGRLRREITAAYADKSITPNQSDWLTADAIDRIAEDVAAIKGKVDAISPEDVAHLLESEKAWVRLVEEQRDAARAEVVRLESFARRYVRCPCCDDDRRCDSECEHRQNAPEQHAEMMAAREALYGNEVPRE